MDEASTRLEDVNTLALHVTICKSRSQRLHVMETKKNFFVSIFDASTPQNCFRLS